MTVQDPNPSSPLDLIVVDDSPIDVVLELDALREAGLTVEARRVDDEPAFRVALDQRLPDAILSDWTMPRFRGRRVHVMAREHCPEVPLIFVSGTISESDALEGMRLGAVDYVYKHQLQRLAPALLRALDEAQTRRSLRDSEEKYRRFFEAAQDGILILEAETGIVRDVNPSLVRMLGCQRENILNKSIRDMCCLRRFFRNLENLWTLQRQGTLHYEETLPGTASGDRIHVEVLCNDYLLGRVRMVQCNIRDVTARWRAEQTLHRVNRALRTLSRCNAVLVRASTEQHLLNEMCCEIVETGGFAMAWVGYRQEDATHSVLPVASFGTSAEMLKLITVTWDDFSTGQGPTGTAIRTGLSVIAHDMDTDCRFTLWREQLQHCGILAAISLPLTTDGAIIGALTIASAQREEFTEEDVSLLRELATDTSYGIAALRRKEQINRSLSELRQSEQRLHTILDNMPVMLVAFDAQGSIIAWNRECERVTGYNAEMVINNPQAMKLLYPDPAYLATMREEMVQSGNHYRDLEWEMTCKDGSIRHIAWSNTSARFPISNWDQWCIGMDVTLRSQAEARLSASLQEKTVLLKEVYHRVKNNLQVVSSLLQLQAASLRRQGVPSDLVMDIFRETQQRVHAMALVHERLYRSGDLSRVNFQSYLRSLLEELFTIYGADLAGIHLHTRLDAAQLSIDQAIPCGLIVNELVTNSLKHAFVGRESGTIEVSFKLHDKQGWLLEVQDDGIGLPAEHSAGGSASLGLRLVFTLANQLEGEVSVLTDQPGTRVQIEFGRNLLNWAASPQP